ncbi:MAG: hypothetical protein KGZ25_06055, partial [Planctomycetes bacterium]|nr:hypothetical protein [Planctomycetota bacterium]
MKTDKLFLRGSWAAILLGILCLVLVGEVSADKTVELRLAPYDRPDVTVDKLDEERPIVNPVSTAQGVEMRQVGVAVTCWARNVRLDGQSVFERYHGRKYVGRVPVVKKKLEPGKHTIWPGEHSFTVTDEGELQSGSPALEIEENVVRIKCYPVTIEAYQSSGPGLSGIPSL